MASDQHISGAGERETTAETTGTTSCCTRFCCVLWCGVRDATPEASRRAFVRADCCSRLLFCWATRLVCQASRTEVEAEDLWKLRTQLQAETTGNKLRAAWAAELVRVEGKTASVKQGGGPLKPSLIRATIKAFSGSVFWILVWQTLWLICVLVESGVILRGLINELTSDENRLFGDGADMQVPWVAIAYAVAFSLAEFGRSITTNRQWALANMFGFEMRSAVRVLVYERSLELAAGERAVGDVVQLVTSDAARLAPTGQFGCFLISAPVSLLAILALMCFVIGPAAIAGLAVLILLAPVATKLAKLSGRFRSSAVQITDERVRAVDEILQGIELIKLNAWETAFAARISDIRARELKKLSFAAVVKASANVLSRGTPVYVCFTTFALATLISPLLTCGGTDCETHNDGATFRAPTVAAAFTTLALFNVARFPLAIFPMAIRFIAESKVGLNRIGAFLAAEQATTPMELTLPPPSGAGQTEVVDPRTVDNAVVLEGYLGSWVGAQPLPGKKKGKGKKGGMKKGGSRGKTKQTEEKTEERSPTAAPDAAAVTAVSPPSPPAKEDHANGRLFDINCVVPRGSLTFVVGPVGSGKSSLVVGAMLGNMKREEGTVVLSTRGVAFQAQSPWIFNGTLRSNILFGSPFDKKWYDVVVEACALLPDFEQLPSGDLSEIGERGVNVSGGQKARIGLARAVYSRADLVFLDDPLAAVDVHVARHLFDKCICGVLATSCDDGAAAGAGTGVGGKQTTRVLVTHQLQFIDAADWIIVVEGGRIKAQGTYAQLSASGMVAKSEGGAVIPDAAAKTTEGGESSSSMEKKKKEEKGGPSEALLALKKNVKRRGGGGGDKSKTKPTGLMSKESRRVGAVKCAQLFRYGNAMGGPLAGLVPILLFTLATLSIGLSDTWVSLWVKDEFTGGGVVADIFGWGEDEATPQWFYIVGYLLSALIVTVAIFFASAAFQLMSLRAATTLHDQTFARLLRAKTSFFQTTPLGRILNRFAADVDIMDTNLPDVLETLFSLGSAVLLSIVVITVVLPWFLVALVFLIIIYAAWTQVYRNAVRQLKRLDSIAKSPIVSQLKTTVEGVATVRAYGVGASKRSEFLEALDKQMITTFAYAFTGRWFGFRLDFVSLLIVTITAISTALASGLIPPAFAALSLTYAMRTGGILQYMTRLISEGEANFTSVERLLEFEETTPVEAADSTPLDVKLEAQAGGWPTRGALAVTDYRCRYRPELDEVLKGVSFKLAGGESLGVVGRTGSGKSTFILSLFRLLESSGGSIEIDGVDIKTLGLAYLRSKLSVIPQNPVLFAGTIRSNLDPIASSIGHVTSNAVGDAAMWNALERVQLKSLVESLDLKLDDPVAQGGTNFSHGERQLFCLARALLRQSKMIVMDEATANVDKATDDLIQSAIASAFSDVTLIVVAHRLSTVLGCDKVLVLDDGRVAEFGAPRDLLGDESVMVQDEGGDDDKGSSSSGLGMLATMVAKTGATEAAALRALAFAPKKSPAAPGASVSASVAAKKEEEVQTFQEADAEATATSVSAPIDRIFKLCVATESAEFTSSGTICSELDAADGFIHLSDRTSAPVVAKLFFTTATDLKLIELSAAQLPSTVSWVVGKMGDAPPPTPEDGSGCVTIHYLLPDGCVHVYGGGGVPTSAIVREADVPLGEDGVHIFPEWL